MNSREQPIRVAVIGGGCAALTAAFELTRPEHQGRYEVTIYQMGWRLGGKGASGRGVADRIEEHGLHLWLGFYENAFRIIRDCYAELDAEADEQRKTRRFRDWRDAFKPAPDVAVMDRLPNGGWDLWRAHFPPSNGLPGDRDASELFTIRGYLRQTVLLVTELLRSAEHLESERKTKRGGGPRDSASNEASNDACNDDPSGGTAAADARVERLLRYGQLASAAALFEASDLLRQVIDAWLPQMMQPAATVTLRLLDAMSAAARRQLESLVATDTELRRVWQVIDLIFAVLRGATINGLALDERGFDAINQHDWRDWLRMNGASEQSLNSGFMRGIYDLAFAFEDGDVTRPRLAAGVALRGAMRMFFTYRGALFWQMSAGMGDVVFAPLYEVLRRRGVRFEFFHRLRNVRLSPPRPGQRPFVEALELDVQARVKGGGAYSPLIDVNGVPSWPAAPDFAQLTGGAALKRANRAFEAHWDERKADDRVLRVGSDFDFVVLGVSVGVLPSVARELIEREPKWRAMVRRVKTVPTQAFQLWMREDMSKLGWPHPPSNLSGFVEPFDTWADMGHLIAEERWTSPVKSIAYFCSVLPDTLGAGDDCSKSFLAEQREVVRANAVRFLERDVGALWPNSTNARGGFRWDLLASEGDDASVRPIRGDRRFDTQYWTANVNPTDRYVLSLPGSLQYRLSPLDMSFDNLTIAGDWTATGLDTGCIESAVMSGRLAAHALSNEPRLEDIVGYDHP